MKDPSSIQFTFLRHGESVGNVEGIFQGQKDFPLTEAGIAQAAALAERWKSRGYGFDQCIASPLQRARRTAEIICTTLNIPLEFSNDWMEVNNGNLAGLTGEEAAVKVPKPEFSTPYDHWGEVGESRLELYLRAGRALQSLMDHSPGNTLIVAHGGILNMVLYMVLGISLHANQQGPRFMFGNTGYARMTYEPWRHSWRLREFTNP